MTTKHYEVQCVTLCRDKTLHTSKSDLIADSLAGAQRFVDAWNDAGRDMYVYTLTGVTKDLTRDELKNLATYEGSSRLYIRKPASMPL